MSTNKYKQHRDAIRTWDSFVRISRNRGLSNPEITEKLRSSGVEEEAIAILLDPNYSWQKSRITGKQNQWKIAVGILKLLGALFFFATEITMGKGILWAVILTIAGLAWFASYSRDNQ